ncbi:MAG TPA: zf-HC2 domain-containing protein [Roseiflexaceae bacterium]|nr:zf-HC2 domain-containing protein [Roseiflexaceae bacterium]
MPHPCEDDLPALALGALDRQEARAIREHVDNCPRCRAALGAYRAVVSLLAYAAQPQEPPADLKHRILARTTAPDRSESATILHERASVEGR